MPFRSQGMKRAALAPDGTITRTCSNPPPQGED